MFFDHLWCLYLLTTPTSHRHMRKPFVWESVDLRVFWILTLAPPHGQNTPPRASLLRSNMFQRSICVALHSTHCNCPTSIKSKNAIKLDSNCNSFWIFNRSKSDLHHHRSSKRDLPRCANKIKFQSWGWWDGGAAEFGVVRNWDQQLVISRKTAIITNPSPLKSFIILLQSVQRN